jgi:L-lysine 2,3-aminomutase
MAHFNHPRELTNVSIQAAEALRKAGVVVVNQTPILSGINNEADTLTTLFRKLSFAGISPYYVFQCRPTTGNHLFQVPVEQSYEILQQSWQACSGLAKRARFVMSHATGKIEIVGKTATHVFMRYHQAAERADIGKFMVFHNDPLARWFDDYRHALTDFEPRKFWLLSEEEGTTV